MSGPCIICQKETEHIALVAGKYERLCANCALKIRHFDLVIYLTDGQTEVLDRGAAGTIYGQVENPRFW